MASPPTANDLLQPPGCDLCGRGGPTTIEVGTWLPIAVGEHAAFAVLAKGRIQRIVVEFALPLVVRRDLPRLEVLRVVAILLDDRRVVLAPGALDSFSRL